MKGFLFCLFSSNRPISELLQPNLLNQSGIMQRHFNGMTDVSFSIQQFESERERLIHTVKSKISDSQKDMIISVAQGAPDWLYEDWSKFPGIAWKLQNIEILKVKNKDKYNSQIHDLERILAR